MERERQRTLKKLLIGGVLATLYICTSYYVMKAEDPKVIELERLDRIYPLRGLTDISRGEEDLAN